MNSNFRLQLSRSIYLLFFFIPGIVSSQTKLTPTQFDSLLTNDKSIQLIDVRTSGELAMGYIEGCKNLDYNADDFAQKLSKLDKGKPVAVYCAVGIRSGRTAAKLKKLGFNVIYDLDGGIEAWEEEHKPLVKPKK